MDTQHIAVIILCCVTECRALWRLHHVQGLWQTPAEGPEEDCGRTTENKRRAERWEVEGKGVEVARGADTGSFT